MAFELARIVARAPWVFLAAAMVLAAVVQARAAAPSIDSFREGVRLYEAERFEDARDAFRVAVRSLPAESDYHHWLGKTYGRLAQRAPWWKAVGLARKSRESLERAVELDGDNADALFSLMVFYRSAPGFVGGDPQKANDIERRLHHLGRR